MRINVSRRCRRSAALDEATAIWLVAEVCSPEDAARVERFIGRIRAVQHRLGQGPDVFGLIR
jgi:hypothetical protein